MPLFGSPPRQFFIGKLLRQRLARAELLRELRFERVLAFFSGSCRRGPFGGGAFLSVAECRIGVGQPAFERRFRCRRLGQFRLATFELPRRGRGLRRTVLQRALECGNAVMQLLREAVTGAGHLRQARNELRFTLREPLGQGRDFRHTPFLRTGLRRFRFRELLLQRLARRRRLVQPRLVLNLTLRQMRRRRRQLGRVPSFCFLPRDLGVGDLLLQCMTLARLVRDPCLELCSNLRDLLLAGMSLRRCALLHGLQGGFRVRQIPFRGFPRGDRLGERRAKLCFAPMQAGSGSGGFRRMFALRALDRGHGISQLLRETVSQAADLGELLAELSVPFGEVLGKLLLECGLGGDGLRELAFVFSMTFGHLRRPGGQLHPQAPLDVLTRRLRRGQLRFELLALHARAFELCADVGVPFPITLRRVIEALLRVRGARQRLAKLRFQALLRGRVLRPTLRLLLEQSRLYEPPFELEH